MLYSYSKSCSLREDPPSTGERPLADPFYGKSHKSRQKPLDGRAASEYGSPMMKNKMNQFRICDSVQIIAAFGGYVVYRSALTGLPPVWARFDTIEEAHAFRKGA